MPNITASGTYTKDSAGFGFLSGVPGERTILFAGTTIGTALKVVYVDDQAVDRDIEDGAITALPRSMVIGQCARDLKIVVTGSPNFNATDAGNSRTAR